MRTLQCHAGPILVRIGVALRLPGPISAGGGVRGSESGCNINLKKVLQGNAAGKCASQPLRATSAAQPKGCSGCSVPEPEQLPPKKCTSSPKPTPIRDKLPPERLFLPKTGPIPGQIPEERHFLPKSNPIPGQTLPAPPKKCTSSPKPTPIRDKSCIGAGAAMHKKAGLRYLNAGRPIYPT